MKVLPQKDAERFLPVKESGKESYKTFVKERIEGESSIWDTIKKKRIPSFTSNNKTTSVKLNGETLQIRKEPKLMNRILVASRSCAEIDLLNIFGTYEFSVVPLSIFATDGSLYYGKDKSVIAQELWELVPEEADTQEEEELDSRKVVIRWLLQIKLT